MSGFLDKNNRIIDMVLTGEGKHLLSKGALHFIYWIPFDDEVDYDPYIAASASMSSAEISSSRVDQIENTLVREATTGYRRQNKSGSDETNVHRPIFTMAQGQTQLPKMLLNSFNLSASLEVKQQALTKDGVQENQVIDTGYRTFDTSNVALSYKLMEGSYPHDYKTEGYLIRVYRSGTDGLQEVIHRRDLENNICFNNDLKFFPK